VLPLVGMAAAGGWSAMMERLHAIDPNLLRSLGAHGYSIQGAVSVAGFVGIGLAFLGAPQLLSRFMSASDRREIVGGSLIAVLWQQQLVDPPHVVERSSRRVRRRADLEPHGHWKCAKATGPSSCAIPCAHEHRPFTEPSSQPQGSDVGSGRHSGRRRFA
jgi:hypothetical protein